MYLFLYITCVVSANALFKLLDPVSVLGAVVPPASVVAGAVFVARDFAHRQYPRAIWPSMLVASVISALVADSSVALASLLAFGVSEFLDALVFTRTHGSFRRRVIVSSLVAVPVDTVLFLWLAFGASIDLGPSALLTCASKLLVLGILANRRRAS